MRPQDKEKAEDANQRGKPQTGRPSKYDVTIGKREERGTGKAPPKPRGADIRRRK